MLTSLTRHLKTSREDFSPSAVAAAKRGKTEGLGADALKGAAVGAGAGAVVGAALGYAKGLEAEADLTYTVQDRTYYSQRPELVGADYDDVDRRRTYNSSKERWETKREDDDWDPIIVSHNDKPYQRPDFLKTGTGILGNVALGALKGAAIGSVVGAVGFTAARLSGVSLETSSNLFEDRRSFLVAGAAGGAVIGGIAGFHAGQVAQQHALREVRTAPVYETRQIGWMPTESNASQIARDLDKGYGDYKIDYRELGGRYGAVPFQGQDPVHAQVQIGETQKEYRSSALTPFTGALVGVAAGSVLGLVTGAAAAVLHDVVTK